MFHWRISLNLVLLLVVLNFVRFSRLELMLCIPHRKYQAKSHSSPWFSAACATAIVHRIHFFRLDQQNESSAFKVQFKQSSNCWKRVLEAIKLGNKTTSQKLCLYDV